LPITSATRFSACAEPMPAHNKSAAKINRDTMAIRPVMTRLSESGANARCLLVSPDRLQVRT
jgi:hypothetical protein